MALTPRQKKFAAAWKGNHTEAAREAGYTGDDATLASTGYRLMRIDEVREAIAKREEGTLARFTLNIVELQELWTATALDKTLDPAVRMAAARDLAKSQGAFVHRHEHAIGKSLEDLLRETLGEGSKK